jgi:sugar/nucleoside kinase (ribokinase family)
LQEYKVKISGIGCCLIDHVYMGYCYDNPEFRRLLSKVPGDGGIIPGGLVFSEDLEQFAKTPYPELLQRLIGGKPPDFSNLGGPAVVALVHASQILEDTPIRFYGVTGEDRQGEQIRELIARTPLQVELKPLPGKASPSSDVLVDPTQHEGKGERSFINTIGAAGFFGAEDVPDALYDAEIVLCGGTALVSRLHDGLKTVLRRAKQQGCITVVGTVYDFRNQKLNPDRRWPLGEPGSYRYIDLLVTDAEEACRLTGTNRLEAAAQQFIDSGVGALIITHGAENILVWAREGLFRAHALSFRPVSRRIDEILEEHPERRKDTTGCGDNFVGGVLVSLAMQLQEKGNAPFDLRDVCAWGASSGGFACMYHGGTYYEQKRGEKRSVLEPIVAAYHKESA